MEKKRFTKKLMSPLKTLVNIETGLFESYDNVIERRLSDMRGMYADVEAYEKLLNEEDKLVYRVYEINIPQEEGQLLYSSSVIYPGKVGNEYFMTKGHFHTKERTAEIYICLRGEGYLLIQTKEAQISSIYMRRGTIGYIPPYWGHRSINTGKEKFIFLAIYPADAGHDYEIIERKGFAKIIIEEDGIPRLKENPKLRM